MQPVWTLSVDLQTKTATFQSGMADAAKAARDSFKDIKENAHGMADGVAEASHRTEYSMMEARHGIMLLGEEFGVHLPRGITTFIASLGPVGAAMEAAFPFLAIILGATLLVEHLMKVGEAAEKAAEAGHALDDDMALGLSKAKQRSIDAEIEIRKLAGEPAWDLLAQKLKLEDADEGIENVHRLDKALTDLIKEHGPTSNWNPLNWGDNSDDLANKAKNLQEQMRGKDQSAQTEVLSGALTLQSKILEQMKGQTGVSSAQLKNQQAYVDFLKQENELIQTQADAAVKSDQAKQGKDRADKIKQAEDEQNRLAEAQQRGADHRLQIEAAYAKKVSDTRKKEAEDAEKLAGDELASTTAVTKEIVDQLKERSRVDEEIGKEEAEHTKKMAGLDLQAAQEHTKELVSVHKSRGDQILAAEIAAENANFAASMRANQMELAALDKYGKDYEVKQRQINDHEAELTKEHENKITQIRLQAEEERNARILAAEQRFDDAIASGAAKVLTEHETFAKMMTSLGTEVEAGLMENAIKSVMANNFTKESDAAAAARKAYLAGMHLPFPANIVAAPALAAMAFASMMAFNEGGIVPGVEKGDVVPARLTPGEAVIPKGMVDNLNHAARHNNDAPQHHVIHVTQTNHVNALDPASMHDVLEQHADLIHEHVHAALRRQNH